MRLRLFTCFQRLFQCVTIFLKSQRQVELTKKKEQKLQCSTRGMQHLLFVLSLGWDQGTHNGSFLSCNDREKAQIFPDTNFGHWLTNWLIINIHLWSIIVQSLHLFVKHGFAMGRCAILYAGPASAVTVALDLSKTNKTSGDAVSAETYLQAIKTNYSHKLLNNIYIQTELLFIEIT